jgi:hypothetical protein
LFEGWFIVYSTCNREQEERTMSEYHLKNRGLKAHALAGGHDGGNLA